MTADFLCLIRRRPDGSWLAEIESIPGARFEAPDVFDAIGKVLEQLPTGPRGVTVEYRQILDGSFE
jgi:hypothetical protein